jgi:hypothetical protein
MDRRRADTLSYAISTTWLMYSGVPFFAGLLVNRE